MQKILVWDWPVRIGHWLMVGGFVIAWLTSESESFRLLHVWAGSAVISVAAFRLIWGFVGTRHARFSSFVRGPRTVLAYLGSLLRLQPRHHAGHNPAGGWAIVALLALVVLSGASGWATYNELGGHWLEELHEGLAATLLAVVLVHLAGVFSGSLLHGENLVRAMITGRKAGEPGEAISSPRPLAAIALLAWLVAAGWWLTN